MAVSSLAQAQNVSAPALLQWFDGSYKTMEYRMADYFMAGYGGLWTPPPGRADSSNGSVGYDVYNRFDLGSAGNPTQYGTETGLKKMISEIHKANGRAYLDLIWNHNGFTEWSNSDNGHPFATDGGGYPGFYMGTGNGNWGDFHDPSASGDENMQLSNLIDINQSANNQFIRNPVNAGDSQNLPAGTYPVYGRQANVPTSANRRFYPDRSQPGVTAKDPYTGDSIIYDFGPTSATNGTPVAESSTGYLMRNARWLIQEVGADGFRLDATKNYPSWMLNYLDKAVYKAIKTPLLDGKTRQQVWSFGENFDSNWSNLATRVRQDINQQPLDTVGGNRDTLDFALFYAMQYNLSGNGLQNDWRNVKESSFDGQDGFANDGSQGVAFVQSHDSAGSPPYLSNVAHAYTLLRPGNAIVYYNGNEFGTRGDNFPQQGRGDALGGPNANNKYITTLVDIRNRYGTGNYTPRNVTSGTTTDKEALVYERDRSVVVALSNRMDNGFDAVSVP
ncbi:MAG TPA: hypothetical protein VF669_00310, partial [Tepidisphaeraceae bacterium]